MMYFRGDSALVICSGWSAKGFTKPIYPFRDKVEQGKLLKRVVRVKCKADNVEIHFSACIMSMPVMSSIGISDCNQDAKSGGNESATLVKILPSWARQRWALTGQ